MPPGPRQGTPPNFCLFFRCKKKKKKSPADVRDEHHVVLHALEDVHALHQIVVDGERDPLLELRGWGRSPQTSQKKVGTLSCTDIHCWIRCGTFAVTIIPEPRTENHRTRIGKAHKIGSTLSLSLSLSLFKGTTYCK
jgi:hypothetical protein